MFELSKLSFRFLWMFISLISWILHNEKSTIFNKKAGYFFIFLNWTIICGSIITCHVKKHATEIIEFEVWIHFNDLFKKRVLKQKVHYIKWIPNFLKNKPFYKWDLSIEAYGNFPQANQWITKIMGSPKIWKYIPF